MPYQNLSNLSRLTVIGLNLKDMEILQNEHLQISVKEHGAELSSIVNLHSGEEMLWQGDPAYWKRRSPVLFPIVGSVWNNHYRYDGKSYEMSQHGFARDMDFTLIEKTDTSILYELRASEDTKQRYPGNFVLQIGYELQGNAVKVIWNVFNAGEKDMHFQIGAHPAFNYKGYNPDADVQGYFSLLPIDRRYRLSTITEKGCVGNDITEVRYDEYCIIPITRNTFDRDALILEDSQTSNVTLLDAERVPYLRLVFDAPVVGLWSPAKNAYAPFVCIEPWYGRCDRVGYEGEFADKDWTLHLKPNESFKTSYLIEIL